MGVVGDDAERGDRAAWSAAQVIRVHAHACANAGLWLVLVGCRPAVVMPVDAGDVQAAVARFAGVDGLRLARLERRAAGAYTLHVAHLEQGPVGEEVFERFSDAQYVVVEYAGNSGPKGREVNSGSKGREANSGRKGREAKSGPKGREAKLAELGVLSFVDESTTHFKRGAGFSLIGARGSSLGPLLWIERATWWRGEPERTNSGHGTATFSRDSLLVCRWTDTLGCAEVPLAATETAYPGADEAWEVRAGYTFDGECFEFTVRGDAAAADELKIPRGRVGVKELFARYPAGAFGM